MVSGLAPGRLALDADRGKFDLRKRSDGQKPERNDSDERDADRQQSRGDWTLDEWCRTYSC